MSLWTVCSKSTSRFGFVPSSFTSFSSSSSTSFISSSSSSSSLKNIKLNSSNSQSKLYFSSHSTKTATATSTTDQHSHGTAVATKDSHGHGKDVSHGHGHGHGEHSKDVSHGHGHGHTKVLYEGQQRPVPEKVDHLLEFEEGDYIPPTETHAFGDEKEELDFGGFEPTVLGKHFGTRENPVEVPSIFDHRIVGCTGSESVEHELLWHEVKNGKDLMCMECGQVFRLKPLPGWEDNVHAHHHDDEHHEEHEFHGHIDGHGFRFMPPPKTKEEREKLRKEREEELKKDPKAPLKVAKATGVDYHKLEEHTDEGRMSAKSPVFHDLRPQTLKNRK